MPVEVEVYNSIPVVRVLRQNNRLRTLLMQHFSAGVLTMKQVLGITCELIPSVVQWILLKFFNHKARTSHELRMRCAAVLSIRGDVLPKWLTTVIASSA